jgi:hypothetical protein
VRYEPIELPGDWTVSVTVKNGPDSVTREAVISESYVGALDPLKEDTLAYYGSKETKNAFRNLAMKRVKDVLGPDGDPRGLRWRATISGCVVNGKTKEELDAYNERRALVENSLRWKLWCTLDWMQSVLGDWLTRLVKFLDRAAARMEPK